MKFDRKGMTKKMMGLLVALLAATMILGSLGATAQEVSPAKLVGFGCAITQEKAQSCHQDPISCLITGKVPANELNSLIRACDGFPVILALESFPTLEAEAAASGGPGIQCFNDAGNLITDLVASTLIAAANQIDLSAGCNQKAKIAVDPATCIAALEGNIRPCA